MRGVRRLGRWLTAAAAIVLLSVPIARAQPYGKPASAPSTAPAAAKLSKPEELEQLVAPIALYPDSLLSQVLMASTYPVEVVMAQRWVTANKSLKGDALTKALEQQTWDPTVKSLVNFPDTLNMMSEKLDWTIKLGDAFMAQQKDILDAVQRLRNRAQAAGNLASNEQQKVTVQPAPTTQTTAVNTTTTQIITIEPAKSEVVYVPTYNPTVVYGTWPYPSYPPYPPYYPPAYTPGPGIWFGAGLALGAAWGYAWGDCDWNGGDVDVDIDKNTNINRNIDREKYKTEIKNRNPNAKVGDRQSFQHDPSHRRGVTYRDQTTAGKFGGNSAQTVQARDAYRGRADAGTKDIARGGVKAPTAGNSMANRPSTPANRPSNTAANRPSTPGNSNFGSGDSGRFNSSSSGNAGRFNSSSSSNRSAFNGSQSSGSSARNASSRGQVSRSSGGGTRSTPVRSGGGGGARAGGGARGGGRR